MHEWFESAYFLLSGALVCCCINKFSTVWRSRRFLRSALQKATATISDTVTEISTASSYFCASSLYNLCVFWTGLCAMLFKKSTRARRVYKYTPRRQKMQQRDSVCGADWGCCFVSLLPHSLQSWSDWDFVAKILVSNAPEDTRAFAWYTPLARQSVFAAGGLKMKEATNVHFIRKGKLFVLQSKMLSLS